MELLVMQSQDRQHSVVFHMPKGILTVFWAAGSSSCPGL